MRIGLCLSGGGARGIYHIGVLQFIKEAGIDLSIISGCSAGALIGVLYSGGVSPEKLLNLSIKTKWFNFLRPALPNKGLMDLNYLEQLLNQNLSAEAFEDLKIPVKIIATNLISGKLRIFETGSVIKPVLASCSVPLLFKPVEIDTELFLDGGILMNLPASIIRDDCDILVGVSLMPVQAIKLDEINSSFKLLTRVLELSVQNNSKLQMGFCDILIESAQISNYSKFDLNTAEDLYKLGYQAAKIALEGKFI
ncbi:MAG: patatin-like phospholipase family protein [Saprospiraceae bacterium]|nr:patatin-like phospholipase family protein [Saprospiraceae bacterium]HRG69358.1 patatin-like phospholipase family protein [Saprospiraceae bacterium]